MNQPQAIEMEVAVLGACLVETTALPQIVGKLREEMFYEDRHRMIYAAMRAMHGAGKQIDILTVTEELRKRGQLEEVGGPFFVTQLSSQMATSAHLEMHAMVVQEKFVRRQMIVGFNKLFALAADETRDIADTLTEAYNLLDQLEGEFGRTTHLRKMDTLMTDTMAEAAERIRCGKDGVTGISTGLKELDRITAGWQKGDLNIIAARPSVGKTAMALHMARTAAKAGYHTVMYSIEMAGERLGDRMILAESGLKAERWRGGQVDAREWEQARAAAMELARIPMHVDDTGTVSMDYIRGSARMLQSKGKCDIIFIDYLQLSEMKPDRDNRSREQEVGQASRKAKLLAKELNVPVILLSQMNREVESRPLQKPILSDLRESGSIEQDADMVIFLYRPIMNGKATDKESGYPSEGLGVAIIAKQRNGQTGNVYFGHNPAMTRIADYVPPLEWISKNAK
ncbi:MAG: putative helicase [Bacteroidetes bacterium]|nr:putative helicase [Bacteroidota bacterium]